MNQSRSLRVTSPDEPSGGSESVLWIQTEREAMQSLGLEVVERQFSAQACDEDIATESSF